MKKTSVILSVVALVVSLLSLYITCSNPSKDWSANLIATLGVICTVLIGWQIFSFIDFRSYEKKMGELETRLIEDENRIQGTQEDIIKTLEQFTKTQKSLMATQENIVGVYRSLFRGQGSMCNGFANIYRDLREIEKLTPTYFLGEQISYYLIDFNLMLDLFSPNELRKILKNIKDALNDGTTLTKTYKDILIEQIDHINDGFEKSSRSSEPELRKVMDEAVSLIHSIPE